MRPILFLAVAIVCVAGLASAQDQVPLKVLDHIKRATVFFKVKDASGVGSGSGFLVRVGRDQHFVITNEHVVVDKTRPKSKNAKPPEIEVVFQSGTGFEFDVKATILTTDSKHDLAVLQLDKRGHPRDALDFTANVKIVETMPIFMVGYPLGTDLALGGRNPEVTIGRGSIANIRDDQRRGRRFQIDGDLNPGNSGGPVVDAAGKLVGVAVSKIGETNIGFVIPADEIPKLLETRIPKLAVKAEKPGGGIVPVECIAELYDPGRCLESLAVRYRLAAGAPALTKSEHDKTWPELPDAETAKFTIAKEAVSARFQIPWKGTGPVKYQMQLVVTSIDNLVARSEPLVVTVDPARASVVAAKERGKESKSWPSLVDLLKAQNVGFNSVKIQSKKIDGYTHGPLVWSNDGKSLYHIDAQGTVRKFSCPGLKEEGRLDTNLSSNLRLAPSAVGLVIGGALGHQAMKERGAKGPSNRIIVADYKTLEVIRSLDYGFFKRIVSSPNSKFAFGDTLASNFNARGTPPNAREALFAVDLEKGEDLGSISQATLGNPPPSLDRLAISPDGKWLLTRDEKRMYRFRVNGGDVKLEETSPEIMAYGPYEEFALSHDGKWVKVSIVQDAETQKRSMVHGMAPTQPFDLFAMESFAKPAKTWMTFNPSEHYGFDRANGYIYGNTGKSCELEVFDIHGNIKARYDTAELRTGGSIRNLLVHPEGRFVAYLFDEPKSQAQRIVLVELLAAPVES